MLALHALLLAGLGLALQRRPHPPLPESPGLLWLLELATRAPPAAAPTAHAAPAAPAQPARKAERRTPVPHVEAQAITLPTPAPASALRAAPVAAVPATSAESTAPAASQASPSLLDGPATRRAIREAARADTLAERAARATDAPSRPDSTERLGQDIAKAGLGDCLKGEYAGGGMGILSLPFFVAAELRGKCRR